MFEVNSIDLQSILHYLIFKTLQLLNIENLEDYYDKSNPYYDLEDLEENKSKALNYYSKYLLNNLIYQLEDKDKEKLHLSKLFYKNNHNLFFDKYSIYFKEVFNKDLKLLYLVYSIVLNDKISTFIIFENKEDLEVVKEFLKEDLNSNLTLKNFLNLENIKDKSFYFNKKDLELLEDIDKTKYLFFEDNKSYYLKELKKSFKDLEVNKEDLEVNKEVLEVLEDKIDLFKSIMINNSLRVNKRIKLNKSSFIFNSNNKVTYSYLSKSSNREDLKLFINFFEDKEDYKELNKDLEVLDILKSKEDKLLNSSNYLNNSIDYLENRIDYLENRIEDLESKEDYYKFSSLLNLDKDNYEDYDNFNYNSYYKSL